MNKFSSILQWIGNTIGANPNTLTTESKTLVGAINELTASIAALTRKLSKIQVLYFDSNTNYPKTNISAGGTGTFEHTYFRNDLTDALQPVSVYYLGARLRSTGTNYNRVFLYGGGMTTQESAGMTAYSLTCYGRNTGTAAASDLVVRFILLVLPADDE